MAPGLPSEWAVAGYCMVLKVVLGLRDAAMTRASK